MKRLQWEDFKRYAETKSLAISLEREISGYAYFVLVDGPVAYSTRVSIDRPEYSDALSMMSTDPVASRVSGTSESDGLHARFMGAFDFVAPANKEQIESYVLIEDRVFDGVMYEAQGNWSDRVSFEVVHPVYGVVDRFATDFCITSGPVTLRVYKADLKAGMILRVVYRNNGANEAKFKANFFLHEKI